LNAGVSLNWLRLSGWSPLSRLFVASFQKGVIEGDKEATAAHPERFW
jgi:hypothetical protein